MTHHLAQANIARARAPLDDSLMAGFVSALDEVNALADRSPGFVWRFQTEGGNATSERAYDDPWIIFNMSVWTSAEALRDYVYRSMHGRVFAQRDAWFEKRAAPHLVLWWVPAGSIPSVAEAKARLDTLARRGESPDAFTFRKGYQSDGKPA